MKNIYEINKTVFSKWAIQNQFRGRNFVFFIIWCLLAVVSLLFGGLSIWVNGDFLYIFLGFWTALFCLYRAFIYPIIVWKRQFGMLSKTYGKKTWDRVISFEYAGVVITEEKTQMTYKYSDIIKIEEYDDLVYLRLKNKTTIRLYKSKFTEGSWDECKEMIVRNNSDLV